MHSVTSPRCVRSPEKIAGAGRQVRTVGIQAMRDALSFGAAVSGNGAKPTPGFGRTAVPNDLMADNRLCSVDRDRHPLRIEAFLELPAARSDARQRGGSFPTEKTVGKLAHRVFPLAAGAKRCKQFALGFAPPALAKRARILRIATALQTRTSPRARDTVKAVARATFAGLPRLRKLTVRRR